MKDINNALKHLRTHQKFPATRDELIKECDNLSDFSEADKEWFKSHLNKQMYNSSEEVIEDLGLTQQANRTM